MKKGDKLFVTTLRAKADRSRLFEPRLFEVDSVGSMYFTLAGLHGFKFRIKDLSQKEQNIGYSQEYKCWHSEDEYEDDKQLEFNRKRIKNTTHLMTKKQIQAIINILNTII